MKTFIFHLSFQDQILSLLNNKEMKQENGKMLLSSSMLATINTHSFFVRNLDKKFT